MKKNCLLYRQLSLILCLVLLAAAATMSIGFAETAVEETAAPAAETVQPEVEIVPLGEGATVFTFEVTDKDGNVSMFEIHTDCATVGEALLALELIQGEESSYGLYVKTVCGVTADYDVDGTYWAFYINGEYAMTGVDQTEVEDGAAYAFRVE